MQSIKNILDNPAKVDKALGIAISVLTALRVINNVVATIKSQSND